jgi:hypothetical protein
VKPAQRRCLGQAVTQHKHVLFSCLCTCACLCALQLPHLSCLTGLESLTLWDMTPARFLHNCRYACPTS